jgi:hypothetical protein
LDPKKSRFHFRAHPFKRPEKWISPHPNPYGLPHVNDRYISNFMDKRRDTRDFRAHSEMLYKKRVRSLRGRIKGVEGWEGGDLEGEYKRSGGGMGKNYLIVHSECVKITKRQISQPSP